MEKELLNMFKREINEPVTIEFRKLISFIDSAISQSFKLSGDERAESLVKNMLNLRDYLSSEIIIESTKLDVKDNITKLFQDFLKEYNLDLEVLKEEKKRKEKDLEEEQQKQENLLETDPSISQKEEEN